MSFCSNAVTSGASVYFVTQTLPTNMDNGSVQVSRELTSAELSRLSVTLNDGSLSEEAKRLRVTGLLM